MHIGRGLSGIAESTPVPCNGCTECCRSGQGLFLHPEQGDDPAKYKTRVLIDQATGGQVYTLATKRNGHCVYLGRTGCTIYDKRPLICRSFDCRKHYLMLPRGDRDNLVKLGLSSRAVFNAGRARLKTLSNGEFEACETLRDEYFR